MKVKMKNNFVWEESRILTNRGFLEAKNVEVCDYVWTDHGWDMVYEVKKEELDSWDIVRTENGLAIMFSGDEALVGNESYFYQKRLYNSEEIKEETIIGYMHGSIRNELTSHMYVSSFSKHDQENWRDDVYGDRGFYLLGFFSSLFFSVFHKYKDSVNIVDGGFDIVVNQKNKLIFKFLKTVLKESIKYSSSSLYYPNLKRSGQKILFHFLPPHSEKKRLNSEENLFILLNKLGVVNETGEYVGNFNYNYVRDKIYNSPLQKWRFFLTGFYDALCTVQVGAVKRGRMFFWSNSFEFTQFLKMILLVIGVETSAVIKYHTKKSDLFYVYLVSRGNGFQIFDSVVSGVRPHKIVGFSLISKKASNNSRIETIYYRYFRNKKTIIDDPHVFYSYVMSGSIPPVPIYTTKVVGKKSTNRKLNGVLLLTEHTSFVFVDGICFNFKK